MGEKLGERAIAVTTAVIIVVIVTVVIVGSVAYILKPTPEPGVVTRADVESYLRRATSAVVKSIISATVSQDLISEIATQPRPLIQWEPPGAGPGGPLIAAHAPAITATHTTMITTV